MALAFIIHLACLSLEARATTSRLPPGAIPPDSVVRVTGRFQPRTDGSDVFPWGNLQQDGCTQSEAMTGVQERIWLLMSESGIPTECLLSHTDDGLYQITIIVNGSVAMSEVYRSELQARTRGWELNRALIVRGWSDEPETGTAR